MALAVSQTEVPTGFEAYRDAAVTAAQNAGVPPDLFFRLVNQESGWNPNAVSKAGAFGLTQAMPDTAKQPGFGVRPLTDVTNPTEQLRFGADYLGSQLSKYDGDTTRALIAYNAGQKVADNWDGNPASLPAETQGYIRNILGEDGKFDPNTPERRASQPLREFAVDANDQAAQMYDTAYRIADPNGKLPSNVVDMYPLFNDYDPANGGLYDYAPEDIATTLQSPFNYNRGGSFTPVTPPPVPVGEPQALTFGGGRAGEPVPSPSLSARNAGSSALPNEGAQGPQETPEKDDEAEKERQGFFDKLSAKLFPKSDDPTQKFADLLGGLGVGLGQMSHGQAVDLSGYFGGLAEQRQAVADSQRAAEQQEFDNALSLEQLAIQKSNADVALLKQAREASQLQDEQAQREYYTSLAEQYPEYENILGAAARGNTDAQNTINDMLAAEASKSLPSEGARAAFQQYVQAGNSGDEAKQANILAGLGPDDYETVTTMLKDSGLGDAASGTDTNTMQMAKELSQLAPEDFPTTGDAYKYLLESKSDKVDGVHPEIFKMNAEKSIELLDEYRAARQNSQESQMMVSQADELAKQMAASDQSQSAITDIVSSAAGLAKSVMSDYTVNQTLEAMGFEDIDEITQGMNEVQQVLARMVAANYKGQGTITDYERKAMMDQVIRGNLAPAQLHSMIERTKMLNRIDQINGFYFEHNLDKDRQNGIELDGVIQNNRDYLNSLTVAADKRGKHTYFQRLAPDNPERIAYEKEIEANPRRTLFDVIPRVPGSVAEFYKETLPYFTDPRDGKSYPTYVNQSGKIVMIGSDYNLLSQYE